MHCSFINNTMEQNITFFPQLLPMDSNSVHKNTSEMTIHTCVAKWFFLI